MSNIFFTSDHHFFHSNIIKYCNRPFKNIDEMHNVLIDNFNNKVSIKDTVYILGDISFERDNENKFINTLNIIKNLNGKKYLIFGNHDKKFRSALIKSKLFKGYYDYLELKYNHKKLILMHYPIHSWSGANKKSIHLHGHSHGSIDIINNELISKGIYRYDIGVDSNNYMPISFDEILSTLKII